MNRAAPEGVVDQVVAAIESKGRMIVGITPEGTRSRVTEWKSGFHRIARAADLGLLIVCADYSKKIVGIGPIVQTTPDYATDLERILDIYEQRLGYRPGQGREQQS